MIRSLLLGLALATAAPALADPLPDVPPEMMARVLDKEELILEKLRVIDGEKHAKLVALKSTDPDAYERHLVRVAMFIRKLGEAGPALPEETAAKQRLMALKAKHPDGMDGVPKKERRAVEKELTQIATDLFEARQAERRRRLDEMREKLTELEADVARRDDDRKALIEAWVERAMAGPVEL